MTGEIEEMKRSHRTVDQAMDDLIEVMADIQDRSSLEADDIPRLYDRAEMVATRLITHMGARDATEGLLGRILGDEPYELDELDANLRDVSRRLEQFGESLDELDEETDVEDEVWQRLRTRFDALVETIRRCSETEWEFFETYSTILEPGGLSS